MLKSLHELGAFFVFCFLILLGSSHAATASAATYTISGQVTDGFANVIAGATVTLSTVDSSTGKVTPIANATADSSGHYLFANVAAGDYSLSPALAGRHDTLTFSTSVNNLSSDITKNLQILFSVTFHVSVRDTAGNGIAGVCIGTNNSITGCGLAGTNSFGLLNIGIGVPFTNNGPPVTFTPEKPGYIFTPASQTLSTQNGEQTVLFTGNPTGLPISFIQFSPSFYSVGEGDGSVNVTVTRTGDTSTAVSADYKTVDTASCNQKSDYIMTAGMLNFAPGETSKTFSVLIIDNAYAEGLHNFIIQLSNPNGGSSLGDARTAGVQIIDNDTTPANTNPIDSSSNFVREQYYDFLNRYPDLAGWSFWTGNINSCGSNGACTDVSRVNVSGAFFLSIEFQQTGYLVERLYKTAYRDTSGNSSLGGAHTIAVPVVRFSEFLPDTQEIGRGVIVNQGNWQQQLEDNKNSFIDAFVQRPRFTAAFPAAMPAAQFVDTLDANAGNPLSLTDRDQLVSDLKSGAKTRAQVLRKIAENPNLVSSEFNRAFVLMQYFGYLRRNPDEAPDSDYSGYDFWLTKLNQFNGDFIHAEMVKAFISADEYRKRFGP